MNFIGVTFNGVYEMDLRSPWAYQKVPKSKNNLKSHNKIFKWYDDRYESLFDTGYSLSNQHILSPINPKYDDWFCQIYEDLHKLFWNSKLALGSIHTWRQIFFFGIFDLRIYPYQILYYIRLCSRIRCSLTYLPTQISDIIYECSL